MKTSRHIRARIWSLWFIISIAIAINIAAPIAALQWISRPSPGLTFDPNLVVNDIGHDSWPSQQQEPPIGYPERLVAIDGNPVVTQRQYNAVLAAHEAGDLLSFSFEQPPPESSANADPSQPLSRTVNMPLVQHSISELWTVFGIMYVTGLIILAIGIWTFRLRPEQDSAQVFALFTAICSITAATIFDGVSTHYFLPIWIACLSLFGSVNLWLNALFPAPVKQLKDHSMRGAWLLLPSIFLITWAYAWLYDPTDPWRYTQPWLAAYFLNGFLLIIASAIMIYRAFRSPSPLIRQQSRLILAGGVLAFTPLFIFFISFAFVYHIPWLHPMLFVLPVAIYPLAVAYTIVRYQLFGTNVVMRRSITYGLLLGVMLLFVYSIAFLLQPLILLNLPFVLAVVTLLIVLLFNPLQQVLQRGVDRYLFKQPLTLDILAQQYGQKLATAVSINSISDILLSYLNKGIPDSTPTLYLPDDTMNVYHGTNGRLIDNTYSLIPILKQENEILDLTSDDNWPSALTPYHDEVTSFNAAIIASISANNKLLGWMTLAPKENKKKIRHAELNYVTSLISQTWIALERANVVRSLEKRVSELDLLSQFSEYLSFTQDEDMLVELVYTNFQRLLGIKDLFIYLRHPEMDKVYKIFHVENDERLDEYEGETAVVDDVRIHEVIRTGRTMTGEDENGRFWIATSLYAGTSTIGALHTFFRQPNMKLRERQLQLFDVFADHTAVALDRLRANRQLKNRARQLEKINDLTFTLSSTLEIDLLLALVLDSSIELLNAEAGTFMLTIQDTGELEFAVVRGPASGNLLGKRLPIGTGLAGSVAQSGRPSIVNSAKEDKRWFSSIDESSQFHTESLLTVPLLRKNSVLGVLQIINKKNGAPFNEEDQRVLTTFTGQAVLAMENARLLEQTDKELRDRVNELFMLQQLDRDLNVTLDLNNVLNLMLDWGLRVADATAGGIAIINDDGDLEMRATHGYSHIPQLTNDETRSGLVNHVMETHEPHLSSNVHEEDGYVSASFSTRSQMTLPIIHKQHLIGIVSIESTELDAFKPTDLEMAMRMTNHAAVAIANALLYEQVNQANLAKSEFVSMVSHELKTPMTSMKGYTDLMLAGMTGELTDQQTQFLETIRANLSRMNRQIQDLTDVSRIETGQLRVELASTHFSTIISETLLTVTGPAVAKEIEIKLDLPSELPPIIGDAGRLIQVLTNLLSNACKYSPEKTAVTVTFHTEEIAWPEDTPPRPMVVCAVRDQGYGMSEEDVAQLFTKFFRSENPDIRKAAGTGLGLVITQGLVELHNGRIWVESALGEGTTFSIAIPQDIDQS